MGIRMRNKKQLIFIALLTVAIITAVLFYLREGDGRQDTEKQQEPTSSVNAVLNEDVQVQEEETSVSYNEAGNYTELLKQLADAIEREEIDFVWNKILYGNNNGTWERFDREQIRTFVCYLKGNPEQRESIFQRLSAGDTYSAKDNEGHYFVMLPILYFSITVDMEETSVQVQGFEAKTIGTQDTLTQGPLLPMEYTITAENTYWDEKKEKKINVDLTNEEIAVSFTSGAEAMHTGGHIVAIDAGHQRQADTGQEPIGPGAPETKPRVSGGATGVSTGQKEYELTLSVADKLKQELISRGYEVVMIRESHDVNISNSARAEIANASGAEVFIRIHANGCDDPSVSGALTMAPSVKNPYCAAIAEKSGSLAENVLNAFCEVTGARNRGVSITDTMSGINWCQIPVTIVEMGFLSNPSEDTLMASEEYQTKMAKGIADGIDCYFYTPVTIENN